MIKRTEKGLVVRSATTEITFEGVRIVSIKDAITGEEFLARELGADVPGLTLFHQNGKESPLGTHPLASEVHTHVLTERIAEIVLNDWECDVSLRISVDDETGDILIEPSAWTLQGGIHGIGLNIPGTRCDLDIVGPFQQGARLPITHPQMQGKRADWPNTWEAGFLVFQGREGGFSVQTWDDRFIFKQVRIGHAQDPHTVSFVTQAYGPPGA